MTTKITTSPKSTRKIGPCQWFLSELSCCCCRDRETSLSSIYFGDIDPNGKRINFESSFSTGAYATLYSSWALLVFVKFLLWAFVVGTFIGAFFDYEYPYWLMSYVTNWVFFYCCLYMTTSLILSILRREQPMASDGDDDHYYETPVDSIWVSKLRKWLINISWVLYTMSVVKGLAIILLYWLTEYNSNDESHNPDYVNVMSHGGVFIVVNIDGLLLNRIPVRLNHSIFLILFGLVYIFWSILQAIILEIDNPTKSPEQGDEDENLYEILNWTSAPIDSTIVSFIVIFVVLPLFTIVFWMISLLCGRRYYINDNNDNDTGNEENGNHQEKNNKNDNQCTTKRRAGEKKGKNTEQHPTTTSPGEPTTEHASEAEEVEDGPYP